MSNIIQHKRNATPGTIPTTGNLSYGELAINYADGKLYTRRNDNAIINLAVSSISGTFITPASGNFATLRVNGTGVSLTGHTHIAGDLPNDIVYLDASQTLTNKTLDAPSIISGVFSDTFTIGSQVFYEQSTNGFSVNEDFDPSNSATQTAYHFTTGAGRETLAFTLARTNQFTDGFGIYGTSSNNSFVTFGEQSNTKFEWRTGVGIRPLDLDGGTLLMTLNNSGNLSVIGSGNFSGNVSAVSFSGAGTNLTGTASSLTAGSVTNGVYTINDQTISGVKTFTNNIVASGNLVFSPGNAIIFSSGATTSSGSVSYSFPLEIGINNFDIKFTAYNATLNSGASWNIKTIVKRNSLNVLSIIDSTSVESWKETNFDSSILTFSTSSNNLNCTFSNLLTIGSTSWKWIATRL